MRGLTMNQVINIIENFITDHNITDDDLKSELYVGCICNDCDGSIINRILEDLYDKYLLVDNEYLYIEDLNKDGLDISINYDMEAYILKKDIYKILSVLLSPYELNIIIFEFYDGLLPEDISSKLNTTVEQLDILRSEILDKLRSSSGNLIDYIHS